VLNRWLYYHKVIPKIKQIRFAERAQRTKKRWCSFEPFDFTKAVGDEC